MFHVTHKESQRTKFRIKHVKKFQKHKLLSFKSFLLGHIRRPCIRQDAFQPNHKTIRQQMNSDEASEWYEWNIMWKMKTKKKYTKKIMCQKIDIVKHLLWVLFFEIFLHNISFECVWHVLYRIFNSISAFFVFTVVVGW